jgi:tRNA(Arg) A34 adenosine deaminase TadA
MELEQYMKIAIEEARLSLREGNRGFGTVIISDGTIIAASHDQEDTANDSTSHAEINAIREASKKLGKTLSGCILVSTHEPCPMCASAIVCSGITDVAYGYSIAEAVSQGRTRIEFPCTEIFNRSGVDIRVHEGILHRECSVLYREDVRKEINQLRNADELILNELNEDSIRRRTKWFHDNKSSFDFITKDLLHSGYRLLLERFRIKEEEAPVIRKSDQEIVFHSMNFCPTLEACKILALDTRHVCKRLNESSTNTLLKQIDCRLNFSRNYTKLRPYTEYCEEMITISDP